MRTVGTLIIALSVFLMSACSTIDKPDPSPTFPSVLGALQAVSATGQNAEILREETLGQDKVVLFRSKLQPGPQVCLVLNENGTWRVDIPVFLSALKNIGPLTVRRENLGHVVQKGIARAKVHVVFGEVLDPKIKWVEVTLDEESAQPQRTSVVNGTWLVLYDMADLSRDLKRVTVRAGDDSGQVFVWNS